MGIDLSAVREGYEIYKANLNTTLTEILGGMRNLTGRQRVAESMRRNLETQLERLNKVIKGKKPAIGPKKEQSTEAEKRK